MAKLTLSEAARACNVARTTIQRAVKTGRLSLDAEHQVDTAELLRIGYQLDAAVLHAATPELRVPLFQPARHRGYVVYIIATTTEAPICKIGMTRNLPRRLQALQSATPQAMTVVHAWPIESYCAAQHLERKLHSMAARFRVRGEWFALSPSDVLTMWSLTSERDALITDVHTFRHALAQIRHAWQQANEALTSCFAQLSHLEQRWGSAIEQCIPTAEGKV